MVSCENHRNACNTAGQSNTATDTTWHLAGQVSRTQELLDLWLCDVAAACSKNPASQPSQTDLAGRAWRRFAAAPDQSRPAVTAQTAKATDKRTRALFSNMRTDSGLQAGMLHGHTHAGSDGSVDALCLQAVEHIGYLAFLSMMNVSERKHTPLKESWRSRSRCEWHRICVLARIAAPACVK